MFKAGSVLQVFVACMLAVGLAPAQQSLGPPNSTQTTGTAGSPQNVSDKVVDFNQYALIGVDGVLAPHVTKSPAIEYPNQGEMPADGNPGLCAFVNERGKVDAVLIAKHGDPGLTQAAVAAVKQWEFDPATKNGQPVPARIDAQVRFSGPEPVASVTDYYYVGCGIAPPHGIRMPDPGYSKAARKAKRQGTVILWLVVNTHGLPEHIKVQRSLGLGLDESAVKAVEHWTFEPAKKDGQPVAVMITVAIDFKLY